MSSRDDSVRIPAGNVTLDGDLVVPPRIQRLAIVPGATHLFEEPGALERVAHLAGDWFAEHLGAQFRSQIAAPA